MTRSDIAAVSKMLSEIAERLGGAPSETKSNAERYAEKHPGAEAAFQSGSLMQICRNESHAIKTVISQYLMPRRPTPRRPRGRR